MPIPEFDKYVPQPRNPEMNICRYMNLAKLINLLSTSRIHLARADVFKDPYEGSVTNPMRDDEKNLFAQYPQDDLGTQISNFRKILRESYFISCWSIMDDSESEAMWKLYCGDTEGVCITTRYQDLALTLPTPKGGDFAKIAPVRYLDYRTDFFPGDYLPYPFFHKRRSFSHGKEVRVVIYYEDQTPHGLIVSDTPHTPEQIVTLNSENLKENLVKQELKLKRGNSIFLDWSVNDYIRDILVHPNAGSWYFDAVKLVVEKLSPQLAGKVRGSTMREPPLF